MRDIQMLGIRMECELHKTRLEEKMLFNERDVAMVSPSIEYMLNYKNYPRHTPFYYSSKKLDESQKLYSVLVCAECDCELVLVISKASSNGKAKNT